MTEAAYAPEPGLGRLWNEIGDLGLQRYIADLDTHGYAVVPPEIASPNGRAERMLEACLDIDERRNGERPDLERGGPKSRIDSLVGDTMKALLLEDPVFEESLMNPVMLALATHLCGYDVILSSLISSMKGPRSFGSGIRCADAREQGRSGAAVAPEMTISLIRANSIT